MTLSIGNAAMDIGGYMDRNKMITSIMESIPLASLLCVALLLVIFTVNTTMVPRLVYGYMAVLVCMLAVSRCVAKGVAVAKTGAAESDFSQWMSNAAITPTIIPRTSQTMAATAGRADDVDAFLAMAS